MSWGITGGLFGSSQPETLLRKAATCMDSPGYVGLSLYGILGVSAQDPLAQTWYIYIYIYTDMYINKHIYIYIYIYMGP